MRSFYFSHTIIWLKDFVCLYIVKLTESGMGGGDPYVTLEECSIPFPAAAIHSPTLSLSLSLPHSILYALLNGASNLVGI